ncbi:hypothetical protein GCM10009549_08870 [Streptomyces thermoalcalitolerans]|uniref:Uncharacterized protein n=1 Tax=Streptomyces thermoalcalitolerans TaxID=65605 RepID=A0ABN1NF17_9ACTN
MVLLDDMCGLLAGLLQILGGSDQVGVALARSGRDQAPHDGQQGFAQLPREAPVRARQGGDVDVAGTGPSRSPEASASSPPIQGKLQTPARRRP